MSKKSKNIVALILAAGNSSRLGKPKQLLPYNNTSLLNTIKEHLTLNFVEQTYIVLGAYAEKIKEKCNLTGAEVIVFNEWKEGMGSSLSYACAKIISEKKYDGILITLSDLPLVNKTDYKNMIDLFENESDIVVTKTNNQLGVPAIFGSAYFEDLLQIKGKKGAKLLIKKHRNVLKVYENQNAETDVDCLEDYNQLINKV